MSYRVKLNVFEGPFDLLVYLIEHAEMSIYDIQISEIVKQYMEHVKAMQITDVNVSSEFMVLAAALLEIKSKMLLPRAVPADTCCRGGGCPQTFADALGHIEIESGSDSISFFVRGNTLFPI